MEFYNEARVDGLQKRVETASEMTEYFMGRDDFLYLRHVNFGNQGDETQRIDMSSKPIMVRSRQEQNICYSDIYTAQNILPSTLGSFSVDTARAKLQMRYPSLAQLLCLRAACLTEGYNVTSCHQLPGAARISGKLRLGKCVSEKRKKA